MMGKLPRSDIVALDPSGGGRGYPRPRLDSDNAVPLFREKYGKADETTCAVDRCDDRLADQALA